VAQRRGRDCVVVKSEERDDAALNPLAAEDAVKEDDGFTGALTKHGRSYISSTHPTWYAAIRAG
jgi:hypothetical protein